MPFHGMSGTNLTCSREETCVFVQDSGNNLDLLLREFGPVRLNYRTEYPFWRLQNDKLWEVSGADKVQLNKSGDPKKSDLINYTVAGGISGTSLRYVTGG